MAGEHELKVALEHLGGLEFKVRFDWPDAGDVLMDEPEPMGARKGPNASRLLAAAIGNCLTASLLFCLQRSKVAIEGTTAEVTGTIARNESGRLRVTGVAVRIDLPVAGEERERAGRCLDLFEDYCVVTGSVRSGIPVSVQVVDRDGGSLFSSSH